MKSPDWIKQRQEKIVQIAATFNVSTQDYRLSGCLACLNNHRGLCRAPLSCLFEPDLERIKSRMKGS